MEKKTNECKKVAEWSCNNLVDWSTAATTQPQVNSLNATTSLNKYKQAELLKQIVQSQMEIKSLEDQMMKEADNLIQTKRAKQLFDAYLELERSNPISVLVEEIRSSITPVPKINNGSDFIFSLLDGSAEIVTKVLDKDDDDVKDIPCNELLELGCFIKDGGSSTRLLQAILLGNIQMNADETVGPLPLRESVSSRILWNATSREEAFHEMIHLFSRINLLVQSVRDLEDTNGFCTLNESANDGVNLYVSMHHEGMVVQIGFLFDNLLGREWMVTTAPNDVKVSVISSEGDSSRCVGQLQTKARSLLVRSSEADPTLLSRICNTMMENFAEAVVSY